MSSNINRGFVVGYGGHAKLLLNNTYYNKDNVITSTSGKHFSLTNASYTSHFEVPMQNSFFIPFDDEIETTTAKSPIRLGGGVYKYDGSIQFQLAEETLTDLWNESFFSRKSIFHLNLNDGENTLMIKNCVWANFSIDSNANSIVNASINFQSNNGYEKDLSIKKQKGMSPPSEDEYAETVPSNLVPYWETGLKVDGTALTANVENFNLSFSRSVNPIYLNNNLQIPSYLKPGLITVDVSLTCTDECFSYLKSNDSLEVVVGKNKSIEFDGNFLFSQGGYNIVNVGENGTKTYSFTSISETQTERPFIIHS